MKRAVKTRAAIVAAAMITGAIASPPVLAGEYVFDRLETADGETYESTRNPTTEAWYPGSIGSASTFATGASVSVSARSSGQVRAVFKWQGDDSQDMPPQNGTLCVKVTSMAYLGVSGEQFYDIEISNGLGAPVVNYTSQSNGLLLAKTNGQQEVKTPYITLKAKGRAEGNDGAWVGAYLSYDAHIENSNPLVWIESPTIEDSYYKGGLDQTNSGVIVAERIKHERNPGLSITTDSALVFDGGNNRWRAGANFEAKTVNFQAPSYVWSYCGAGSPDGSSGYNSPNFVLGLAFGPPSNPFPDGKETVLEVDVTDANGTQASNTFTVNWHLPYENFVKTGENIEVWSDLIKGEVEEEGQAQADGNTFVCTFEYDRKYGFADGLAAASATFTLASAVASGGSTAPLTVLLMAGLGMAIDQIDLGLVHANNVVVSQAAWNEAQKHPGFIPAGLAYDDAVMIEGYMAVYYDLHYYRFDYYDQHGFVELRNKTARVPSAKAPVATGKFAEWRPNLFM